MEMVIYLYNGITALDAVGPYEVLSRMPGANIKFAGETKGLCKSLSACMKLNFAGRRDCSDIQACRRS